MANKKFTLAQKNDPDTELVEIAGTSIPTGHQLEVSKLIQDNFSELVTKAKHLDELNDYYVSALNR